MASYLRPKRGKKNTAINQNIILKKGEIFFEVPDTGVGKGEGNIKMGDGITGYNKLPYFINVNEMIKDGDPKQTSYILGNIDEIIDLHADYHSFIFGHSDKLSNLCGYWVFVFTISCFNAVREDDSAVGYFAQIAIGRIGMKTRYYDDINKWSDWI